MIRKSVVALSFTVLMVFPVALIAEELCKWSMPENLASVNTPYFEGSPFESSDGKSLYFHSLRPGLGINDLYVSHRESRSGEWGPAVRIGPPVSSPYNEVAPALSWDGHYLFFATDRPGGKGGLDIWAAYRPFPQDDFAWEDPVPITAINAPVSNDAGPWFVPNGPGRAQLYFQSNRGAIGATDIYVSGQQEDGAWGAPVLISELSSQAMENRPSLTPDGREIFFQSNRPGSAGTDIWTSRRQSPVHPWSEPVNVGWPINGASEDTQPGVSHHGKALYFTSDRRVPGTLDSDIWVSMCYVKGDPE